MKFILALLSTICICIACQQRQKLQLANTFASSDVKFRPENAEEVFEEANDQEVPSSPVEPIERKLIKDGRLTFRTKDVKKTKEEIEKICKELGAYISNETQTDYENGLSYSEKIRVPAARFDELMQKIEPLAEHIDIKNIDTKDVTEEFIDVESRLKTKKDLEKRYTELLQKAKTVEDLLSIERELGNVRSEIESMEGRLNYLKNQVAFSTLDVNFYEQRRGDFGFASRFVSSMGEGWNNLLSFIIGLMSLWPFVLLASAGTWTFVRYRRKRLPSSTQN
jgi:hypothetical protein